MHPCGLIASEKAICVSQKMDISIYGKKVGFPKYSHIPVYNVICMHVC